MLECIVPITKHCGGNQKWSLPTAGPSVHIYIYMYTSEACVQHGVAAETHTRKQFADAHTHTGTPNGLYSKNVWQNQIQC